MLQTEPMKYLNSGIYMVVNKINNKRYIGQTSNLTRRKYEHFIAKKRPNPLLRNSMKKHGVENFEFIVLEYLPPDKENLTAAEQRYLDFYKDKWDRLYNLCPIAETTLGLKATDKAKENISKALKGKKKSESHIQKMKDRWAGIAPLHATVKATELNKRAINQIDLETGEILNTFPSLKDAAIAMEAPNSGVIGQVARGYTYSAYGFKWAYVKSPAVATKDTNNCKKVIQCDLNGNEILRFKSLHEASRHLGIKNPSNISRCVSGKQKQAHGYIWK